MTTNLMTKSLWKTRRLAAFAVGLLVLCGAVTGEVLAKDHSHPGSRYKVKLFPPLYRRRYDDELTGSRLSPTQYVEHSAGVDFYISTKTNKIIDVERWERIRDFSFAKGVVTANVSEETFDTAENR